MTLQELKSSIESLQEQLETAQNNGNYMEETRLFDALKNMEKRYMIEYIKTLSSGYIAMVIGSERYTQIDIAYCKTMRFLFYAEPCELINYSTEPEDIDRLILDCYKNSDLNVCL